MRLPLRPIFYCFILLFVACKQEKDRSVISPEISSPMLSIAGDSLPTGVPVKRKGQTIKATDLPQPLQIKASPKVVPAPSLQKEYPITFSQSIPLPKGDTIYFGKNGVPFPNKVAINYDKVKAIMPEASNALPFYKKDKTSGHFEFLGMQQGLSSSRVMNFLEDKKGFIWLASQNGLSRYDGKSFRHYTAEHGLPNREIYDMVIDSLNNIWIATQGSGGLIKFDGEYFYHFNPENGLDLENIGILSLGQKGTILIQKLQGGYLTKVDGQYATTFGKVQESVFTDLLKTFHDAEGKLWAWSSNALFEIQETFTVKHALVDIWDLTYSNSHYYPTDKTFWMGKGNQLCKKNEGQLDCYTSDILNKDPFFNLSSDVNGHPIFIHLSGAISLLKGTHLQYTKKEDLIENSFEEPFPHRIKIINDKIWWTKKSEGMVRYKPNTFQHFPFPMADQLDIASHYFTINRFVSAILEDSKNDLWFGTHGAELITYNGRTFTTYPKASELLNPWIIRQVYEDSKGIIWIASNEGLTNYDGEIFTNFYLNDDPNAPFSTRTITEDTEGNMWFGSGQKGLIKYDGTNFTIYSNEWSSRYYENKNGIRAMITDRNGNVWIGYQNIGLAKYDGESFTFFTKKEGLADNHVTTLFEDTRGNIWVGTEFGGVSKIAKEEMEDQRIAFINYTKKDGLSYNDIWTVSEDGKGQIWLGADGCLNLLEFDDLETELTGVTEFCNLTGVESSEFFSNATLLDHTNKMWWGSSVELITLAPDVIRPSDSAPKVFLDEIQINQSFVDFDQLNEKKEANQDYWIGKDKDQNLTRIEYSKIVPFFNYPLDLTLPFDFNHLTFRFAATKDPDLSGIRFSCLMEGYDLDWSPPNTANKIDYRNIPPGTYTFHVKAIGSDNNWSEAIQYSFTINPPWWKTWWAYLAYIALFLGTVYAFWRVNLKQRLALEESKRMKELNGLKTRLYTNITHEFRTPLTVIMGMNENIEDHPQEKKLIRRNSKNLLRLVNQLLDLSKLESGNLKLENIQGNIVHYLQYLTESFYSMANEKDIRLTFYTEAEELVMDYDEAKIQHIVYNLLSNAIKFTPKEGKVILHIQEQEQNGMPYLKMKVKDTGIGIDEERLPHVFDRFYQVDGSNTRGGEGTGIGLTLVKELVEMMEGQIEVSSKLDKGTEFNIWLPIKTASATKRKTHTVVQNHENGVEEVIPESTESIPLEIATSNNGTDKPEVLIIEDNKDVVTYIEKLLRVNYTVHIARDGAKGIAAAIELVPDVIISDVMMPEKDGYEVCETLKQDVRTSHIPIILLTAKSAQEDKVAGLKYGADAFLSKPFDKEELFIRLEKLIELRRQLQSYYSVSRMAPTGESVVESPTPIEDEFLQKMRTEVEKRMEDSDFGVIQLVHRMAMSNTQMYRKLKALTGKTPSQFIREIRLQKGYELLNTSDLNISEIAYEVGFSDPNYFSRTFQKKFGKAPRDIRTT